MGFVAPLFLLAGLAVLAPVIIHLVNLRRYKRELFPNVRFLRKLQVSSKRSSQLRKRWLLLMRLLFIIALVLAFAQPFRKSEGRAGAPAAGLSVIYIDNSYSMSAQKDGNTLLALAKDKALQLIADEPADARFMILSNDHLYYTSPIDKQEAIQAVSKINRSRQAASLNDIKQVLSVTAAALGSPQKLPAYLFSDFQASTLLPAAPDRDSLPGVSFYLFPMEPDQADNVFLDSASFQNTRMNREGVYPLIVTVGRQKGVGELTRHLRLSVDGQARLVHPVVFPKGAATITDTLPVALNEEGWVKATLSVDDAPISFDDTLRLVAKVPSGFSVLILTRDNKVSPYLQAAFSSMPGVSRQLISPDAMNVQDLKNYSLIVVQNGTQLGSAADTLLTHALQNGTSVLLFPGTENRQTTLNNYLNRLGTIQLGDMDTSEQQVVVLHQNHPLIEGLFESIPQQIQLPAARRHFRLSSGLSANRQDVMSFADGAPLLASFDLNPGMLYICTAPLEGESSNFPLSYFFAPMLYKMVTPFGAVQLLTTSIGSQKPVWIASEASSRPGLWYLYGEAEEQAPPQKMAGQGLAVYVGKVARQTGFYRLKQEGVQGDSLWVAVNHNPLESDMTPAAKEAVAKALAPQKVFWLDEHTIHQKGWQPETSPFPLWKAAVWIALLCLVIETLLLIKPPLSRRKLSTDGSIAKK